MENELTPRAQMKYSVTSAMDSRWSSKALLMDENIEAQGNVPKKEEEKKTPIKPDALSEIQQKVQKEWEKFLREKAEKGEKITQEDQQRIINAIKKGEGPTVIGGGSGDGKFENFNADKYKNTPFEDIAKRLKQAGQNNAVTQELLDDIQRTVNTVGGLGNEDLSNDFVEDFGKVQQMQNPRQNSEPEMGEQDTSASRQRSELEDKLANFGRRKEQSGNPRSIQEVAQSIIYDEGRDRWGEGGAFPLLDADKNLNQANFVRWFRERMMYHHLNNSRDYQLQLGNLVGITNMYGNTTSIFAMDKDRGQYFLDANTGRVMDQLANQLKNELWLFGNMRNYDLLYQEYMGSDSELPKFLAQVHGKEEITQPGSLKTIMTMSKDYGVEGDTSVGDAVRKAYEIYYYASDFEELQKILGKNSIFFKKEGFENAFKIIEKKAGTDTTISEAGEDFIKKIFSKEGGAIDPAAFIEAMNPFNNQNKPEFNKSIMREMVRQAVAEKYGLEYGLNKSTKEVEVNGKTKAPEREFLRKDLEYAEAWAWILTRWTGAAARNDTAAIGFDAFTKVMKLQDYRVRQSNESRAGQFGNEYDLPVFKSLVQDFFDAVTVEKKSGEKVNTTPFELFRRLDAIEDDKSLSEEEKKNEKKKIADRMNFEQFTQKAYLANHINRGFEIFHSTMGAEEMKLEEIVKWDPFRGIILDRGKFEEQIKEKFLKPIRYAFSTYAQLDFGKTERVLKKVPKTGELPEYKEITVAEKIFGPEVLKDLRPMAKERYKDEIKKGDITEKEAWQAFLSDSSSEGGRRLLWKRAAMARMAAHIKSHRQFANNYAPFSIGMVNTLYDALESIKSVEIDPEDETTMNYAKRFLTKEDIDWIRKHSGTTQRRLFIQDIVLKSGGYGLAKGVWEGAGAFIRDIFK